MKELLVAALLLASTATAFAQESRPSPAPRMLIAYFSHTNNTRTIAEQIQKSVGGDLFQISVKNPYSSNHQQTVDRARGEKDRNERPELASTLEPEVVAQYDVIFVGYPNWWNTMPMAMRTFLEQYDLSGKTLVPFCTHEGSGLGASVRDLQSAAPGSTILDGLQVRGRSVSTAQNEVSTWLRALRFIR